MSDEDEEKEKNYLGLSILNFLKYVTKDSSINKMLATYGSQEDTLKKMLYYEQTNTCNTAFILTPVEIETTQLGMNFAALKSVIS